MSRIQQILERAERDGNRGMRVVADPATIAAATVAAVGAVDTVVDIPPSDTMTETAAPPDWAEVPVTGRIISDVRLSHRLTAAAANGLVAEQYRALRTRILHADNGSAV